MAETLSFIDDNVIVTQKPINRENPGGESTESLAPPDKSPFRRIEFHLARKPFAGFTNGGGDGSFRLETLNPATTSSKNTHGNQQSVGLDAVGGSSGKKRDASELENGLDPELSFGITFRRIGAGLENLGNTCFLNSVLQCLTYTEPLAAYLQSGKHQVTCRKAGFCALCAIQKHVSCALQSSGRSLAPKDLVSNLRCISRTFRNSRQEDAHEYMVNLLESMHKCCLPTGVPSESQSAYDRSLVHKIFGGRLRSQVKCMQCNYCSNKFDPFLDLSLEILKADTLYKAFANFTTKEQLDGGAKQYQCQQCKQKVKALKQLTIHKAPNVLTVHLKRFGSHMSGQKIDKKIQFGSTLDLKPFVTGPYDGDLKYTLYGVLVHAGWSTHSGHYYCFVRTSSGMWYSLDDNRVIQVSEKKVFEQKAYMLFYFRDRKSFPSKKPADVHQKEKIVMNGTLNGPSARKENQTNAGLSNGSLNAHKSLATVGAERNGFSPNLPKEIQMNKGLSNGSLNARKSLSTVGTERSGFSPDAPKETQINTSLSNGSLSGHKSSATVGTLRNGFSVAAPEQAQKKEGSVPKSISEFHSESSPKCKNGDFSISISMTVSCSKPLVTTGDNVGKTEKFHPVKEIGGNESFGANSHSDGQEGVVTASAEISDLPKMGSSVEKEAVGQKKHKKPKNFLKCKVPSMKFSSNIFMGASLIQRKKKKHKRSKKIKNLVQENSIDEGPSSSHKIEAQATVKPSIENELKERVHKDVAVLATSDLNGVSAGSRAVPNGPNHLDGCKGASAQKGLVHMLTRGLEDRTVPRWDEDESIPSQIRETTSVGTIGYVGDEWDEEYDRGKRKKVRISKTEFDGKNPFQDIANERLKVAHAEKQQLSKRPSKNKAFKESRSGNRPFRI